LNPYSDAVIVPNAPIVDCARECAHVAGCLEFNDFQNECQLWIGHGNVFESSLLTPQWNGSGRLVSNCFASPFQNEFVKGKL